jgi:hypothetical protein
MSGRLSLVACGAVLPHAVAPYLRLIGAYYREFPGEVPAGAWFSQTIVPLFSSVHLPMFHVELQKFCSFMQSYVDDAAEATVRYLVTHWPVSESVKLPLVLDSLRASAARLTVDARRTLGKTIFRRIADMVASDHATVSQAALAALANVSFLGVFGDDITRLLPVVCEAARAKLDDSNPVTSGKAHDAIAAMNGATVAAADRQPRPNNRGRAETWELIAGSAPNDAG